MPLSRLLDIALYNNPLTRVSWNAARASAYAYRVSLAPYYPHHSLCRQFECAEEYRVIICYVGSGYCHYHRNSSSDPSWCLLQSNITYALNNISLNYLVLDFGGRDATAELALQTLYASNWDSTTSPCSR